MGFFREILEAIGIVSPTPALVKEPDDLGTPDLPRPSEVPWLSDQQKVSVAIEVLKRTHGTDYYDWAKYYIEKQPVEEIVCDQEQCWYDYAWKGLRACWKTLQDPFWAAYVAGHFPNPQVVKGKSELAKEICVLDVKELTRWQADSLIEDGVYTLRTLQNGLFNDYWRPAGMNDRDKWHFRRVLMEYGLEVPSSDEPYLTPFAELFIGAVFGVKVTREKRLSSYDFIQGDEPLEDRVQRIQEDGLVYEGRVEMCEDILFYLHPESYGHRAAWAIDDTRKSLKAKKILAGGDYPKVRSWITEDTDLDALEKILAKDLELSSRAKLRIREFFGGERATLADLVQVYPRWLLVGKSSIEAEINEYLYEHGYVIRPEDMPMDERTHFAYLGLPVRVRDRLYYPGQVETVDDLLRCCAGNDPVFSFRDLEGIGKSSVQTIRARLIELGLLTDSE